MTDRLDRVVEDITQIRSTLDKTDSWFAHHFNVKIGEYVEDLHYWDLLEIIHCDTEKFMLEWIDVDYDLNSVVLSDAIKYAIVSYLEKVFKDKENEKQ